MLNDESLVRFPDFNLNGTILKAIDELGFEEPSPIQARAIPPALEGRDLIGQAQTGTGKTAAFAIPIVQLYKEDGGNPYSLILTPTRELCIQVAEEISRISRYTKLKVLPIYGGQHIGRQIKALKRGVDVVVGTPGRLLDHIGRKTINLDDLHIVVLDEADEMLNMGFIDDVETILEDTPRGRQTLLFSATMPPPIARLARKHMNQPEHIKIRPDQVTAPDIEQVYFEVRPHERFEALCRIIDSEGIDRSIIFCRTKRGVDELAESLSARGYQTEAIHGDLDQRQRTRVMRSFKDGHTDLLVATDVAARGVDVDNVTHVINYDLPASPDVYVHRIGRTGRAGKVGTAITLIHPRELRLLRAMARHVRANIARKKVPTIADVEERQRSVWRERLAEAIEEQNFGTYRQVIEDLVEEYDSIDVGAAALKLLVDGIRERESSNNDSNEIYGDTGAEAGMVRFFMNIGRKHGVSPADVVRTIAETARIPGGLVGRIDIYGDFLFVEVPEETAPTVIRSMQHATIKGRPIHLEPARR